MEAEEKEICEFLKAWPGAYVSSREISKRAGGKWRYRENPNWAMPILARLVELQLVESDSTGHYRLIIQTKKSKPQKWLSPAMRKALEEKGHEVEEPPKPVAPQKPAPAPAAKWLSPEMRKILEQSGKQPPQPSPSTPLPSGGRSPVHENEPKKVGEPEASSAPKSASS